MKKKKLRKDFFFSFHRFFSFFLFFLFSVSHLFCNLLSRCFSASVFLPPFSPPLFDTMKRHFAVAVALVLLVGCSGFAAAQDNKDAGDDATPSPSSTSGAILPPVKPNVAITNGSNETRGPVKAIDCASNANGTITVTGTGRASGAPDVARVREGLFDLKERLKKKRRRRS